MPADHIYAECKVTLSEKPSSPYELIVEVPGSTLDALHQNPLTENLSNLKPFADAVGRDFLLGLKLPANTQFTAHCNLYSDDEVPLETQRPPWGNIGELTIWVVKWAGR